MARGELFAPMKKLIAFLLFGAASIGFFFLDDYLRDGFALRHIASRYALALPPVEQESPPEALFNQEFTYLAKGTQVYVFASADGNYVLKFFRHSRFDPPLLHPERAEQRDAKRQAMLKSTHLAFTDLKEESGLIYIHLTPTVGRLGTVRLRDALGTRYELPLDSYEFFVQKRAEGLYPHLSHFIASGDKKGAQEALDAVLGLLVTRYEKGIKDYDATLHRNLGFVGNRPIFLDVGQFERRESIKDPAFYCKEMQYITRKLNLWLQSAAPELNSYLLAELASNESCRHMESAHLKK